MRGKGSKLLLVCTLLFVAAGAMMPFWASAWQDHRLGAEKEVRPLDGIALILEKDRKVEQTLSLLAAGYSQVELEEGRALTRQEAEVAAKEAVALFIGEGLLPEMIGESLQSLQPATVFAAIATSDRSQSAVIWECTFKQERQFNCTIWIDDATGKLVNVRYTGGQLTSTLEESDRGLRGYQWGSFLQEYYGLALVTTEESYSDETGSYWNLELTWMVEDKPNSCTLPMLFRSEETFFCW